MELQDLPIETKEMHPHKIALMLDEKMIQELLMNKQPP